MIILVFLFHYHQVVKLLLLEVIIMMEMDLILDMLEFLIITEPFGLS